jgi:hypothetical protein
LGPDQYEIRGRQSLAAGTTLYFVLQCKADQLGALLTRTPGIFDVLAEFAIAATITRLSKPMFKASADTEIAIEPGDAVIVAGVCLEVVRFDD